MKNLRFQISQTIIRTGDLEGNYRQVINEIDRMAEKHIDILVFPETALTGYCCGALWENADFVVEQKKLLFDISVSLPFNRAVIIGFVNHLGLDKDGYPILTNSAAVINNGHIGIYDKQLLASRDHHEDVKYFRPGSESKVFELTLWCGKITVGVPICEDIWFKDHEKNVPREMCDLGAELLISINQSYFHYGKMRERIDMARMICCDVSVPLVYANAVGLGDIVKNIMIFDGGSFVMNRKGKIVTGCPEFAASTLVVGGDLIFNNNCVDVDAADEGIIGTKYSTISEAIIFAQREMMALNNIKKAQVHLSGGIDSAVVGALMVYAEQEPGDTVFITNPSVDNGDETRGYANHVATMLGVDLMWENIDGMVSELLGTHSATFKDYTPGVVTCAHAVGRTVLGLMASHQLKSCIIPTCNHTEIVLGWANFHDIGSIGLYAPIGDLTKTEVFELAEFINESAKAEVIPHQLYDGGLMPAAELPNAKFDPIDYFLQSGICANMIRLRMSKHQQLEAFESGTLRPEYFKPLKAYGIGPSYHDAIYKLYNRTQFSEALDYAYAKARTSVYKAAQGAPILILSPRSRGFSNRETILNLYKSKD